MDKAAKAGRDGASQEELGRLKDKYSKAEKNKTNEDEDLGNLLKTGVKGSYGVVAKAIKDFEELIRNNPNHPKVPQVKAELAKLKPMLAKAQSKAIKGDAGSSSVEDVIKTAIKDLKRIDRQAFFRDRDVYKAEDFVQKGNIPGAIEFLIKGVEGPENQIQDVYNDLHDGLNAIINPPSAQDQEDEYWADVDADKAKDRVSGGYRSQRSGYGKNI